MPRVRTILGAMLVAGAVGSVVAPVVWKARNIPDVELDPGAAPDPSFVHELACRVSERCKPPLKDAVLHVGAEVSLDPADAVPPGWLDCARREVQPYAGLGDVPISVSPCR